MKYLFVIALSVVVFASCNDLSKKSAGAKNFGKAVDTTQVITIAAMLDKMNSTDKLEATTTGKITDVCKSEGCWMTLDEGNGKELYVSTEEKFFMPKDVTGKEVIITGYAFHDTTSVEQLRSEAKDAGKTEQEINQITTPTVEVSFIAEGVIIK